MARMLLHALNRSLSTNDHTEKLIHETKKNKKKQGNLVVCCNCWPSNTFKHTHINTHVNTHTHTNSEVSKLHPEFLWSLNPGRGGVQEKASVQQAFPLWHQNRTISNWRCLEGVGLSVWPSDRQRSLTKHHPPFHPPSRPVCCTAVTNWGWPRICLLLSGLSRNWRMFVFLYDASARKFDHSNLNLKTGHILEKDFYILLINCLLFTSVCYLMVNEWISEWIHTFYQVAPNDVHQLCHLTTRQMMVNKINNWFNLFHIIHSYILVKWIIYQITLRFPGVFLGHIHKNSCFHAL